MASDYLFSTRLDYRGHFFQIGVTKSGFTFSSYRTDRQIHLVSLMSANLGSMEATEARKKQPLVRSFGESDWMARRTVLHPSSAAKAAMPVTS